MIHGGTGPGRPYPGGRSLVGRKEELEVFARALEGLWQGEPRIIEVSGDPGIGKTALLAEVARGATIRGQVVLGCRAPRAARGERTGPFGMVLDTISDHLGRLEHGWLGATFAELLAEFFHRHPGAGDWPPAETEFPALFDTVGLLLEQLAEPDGLVLFFDDVHRADAASARLIAHLLRHPPRGPVLITVTYRPRQLARWTGAGPLSPPGPHRVRLELGPLSEDEAGELIGPGWSRAQRRMFYRISGGVPFYLDGLAVDGVAESGPGAVGAEGLRLSPRAVAVVRGELAELSSRQLLVAQAAAVAGDPFSSALVAELAQLDPAEVREAVDGLVGCDLIRPVGSSAEFAYRHRLIRQVVYESADEQWRMAAHARAAAALADRDGALLTRARHLELIARKGDEQAAATFVEAANRTLSRAPAEAADWLRSALRLFPDSAEMSARRLDLMIAFAKALSAGGRLAESGEVFHEVVHRLPRGQRERRAQVVAMWARTERLLGRHSRARTLLRRELERLPADDGLLVVEALRLELIAAALFGDAGVVEQGQLKELAAAVDAHPDPVLRAAALALVALAHCAVGPVEEAEAVLPQAARLVDGLSDDQLAHQMDAVVWASWSEIHCDRYTRAMRHLGRGLRVARAAGLGSDLPRLLTAAARLHTIRGRLPEAVELADEAVEASARCGSDGLRTMALTVQCQAASASGDVEMALRAGSRAAEMVGWIKGPWRRLAWAALAEARLLAGDVRGCFQAVDAMGGGAELAGLPAVSRPEVFELLTRAEIAAGRWERAETWAEHAAAAGRSTASGGAFALLAQAQALAEFAPETAVERALEATAIFTRLGRWVEVGRARLAAGLACALAGEPERGHAEIGRAEALFEQSGARLLLNRVRREQRRITEVAASAPGPRNRLDLLTRREMQVAVLVSEGLTNRRIAQRLGVTDKTVEAHLARIFGKLGLQSRAAVAVLVAQSAKPGDLWAKAV